MTIVQEQPQITAELAKTITTQHVVHAYLFTGSNQAQVQRVGIWFMQALFCPHAKEGYPCLQCNFCQRIQNNDFPDVLTLATDKKSLGVDDIREAKRELEQTSVEASGRILLIKQAEKLTTSAANSLLKFLEDPVGKVTALLLTKSVIAVLPTIQSRVQILSLADSVDTNLQVDLQEKGYSDNDLTIIQQAHLEDELMANIAGDKFKQLKQVAQTWVQQLAHNPWQAFIAVSTTILPAVENRLQQQLLLSLMEWYFSQQLNQAVDDHVKLQWAKQITMAFLHAKQLWTANVSLQNSLEQLALQATNLSKRG
ncbi:hypothetical protein [Bombilactobacillus thymidiniphilus]|uniref:DNA polymerase III subunit delta n=1 Tax=Bombilactobacillus thymidiniphilus TaxID=2923363 RepID=A0ABY4PDV9_9LACO|nr:hypothetical protein [Bombilactobacillus thymidiniphilus]UQS83930.1 hypothetical protein MOO47_01700 [Bombilactobacillus thymidiniphilus]